jgi:hypothetical protein
MPCVLTFVQKVDFSVKSVKIGCIYRGPVFFDRPLRGLDMSLWLVFDNRIEDAAK